MWEGRGLKKEDEKALEAAQTLEACGVSRGSLPGIWGQEGSLRRLETGAYKRGADHSAVGPAREQHLGRRTLCNSARKRPGGRLAAPSGGAARTEPARPGPRRAAGGSAGAPWRPCSSICRSRCFWMAMPSTSTSMEAPYTSHVMPFSSQLTSRTGSAASGGAKAAASAEPGRTRTSGKAGGAADGTAACGVIGPVATERISAAPSDTCSPASRREGGLGAGLGARGAAWKLKAGPLAPSSGDMGLTATDTQACAPACVPASSRGGGAPASHDGALVKLSRVRGPGGGAAASGPGLPRAPAAMGSFWPRLPASVLTAGAGCTGPPPLPATATEGGEVAEPQALPSDFLGPEGASACSRARGGTFPKDGGSAFPGGGAESAFPRARGSTFPEATGPAFPEDPGSSLSKASGFSFCRDAASAFPDDVGPSCSGGFVSAFPKAPGPTFVEFTGLPFSGGRAPTFPSGTASAFPEGARTVFPGVVGAADTESTSPGGTVPAFPLLTGSTLPKAGSAFPEMVGPTFPEATGPAFSEDRGAAFPSVTAPVFTEDEGPAVPKHLGSPGTEGTGSIFPKDSGFTFPEEDVFIFPAEIRGSTFLEDTESSFSEDTVSVFPTDVSSACPGDKGSGFSEDTGSTFPKETGPTLLNDPASACPADPVAVILTDMGSPFPEEAGSIIPGI